MGGELEIFWNDVFAVAATKHDQGFENGSDLDEYIAKMAAWMDAILGIYKGHERILENHLSDRFARMMAKAPGC